MQPLPPGPSFAGQALVSQRSLLIKLQYVTHLPHLFAHLSCWTFALQSQRLELSVRPEPGGRLGGALVKQVSPVGGDRAASPWLLVLRIVLQETESQRVDVFPLVS